MAQHLNNTNFFGTQEQGQGVSQSEGYTTSTIVPSIHSAFEDVLLDTALVELDLLPLDQLLLFQSIAPNSEVATSNSSWNQRYQVPDFQNGTKEGIPSNEQKPSHQTRRKTMADSPSVCHEEGCESLGPFFNRYTLNRHIQTQHRARGAFKCPHNCKKVFNRKDNLDQHLRAVHWDKL